MTKNPSVWLTSRPSHASRSNEDVPVSFFYYNRMYRSNERCSLSQSFQCRQTLKQLIPNKCENPWLSPSRSPLLLSVQFRCGYKREWTNTLVRGAAHSLRFVGAHRQDPFLNPGLSWCTQAKLAAVGVYAISSPRKAKKCAPRSDVDKRQYSIRALNTAVLSAICRLRPTYTSRAGCGISGRSSRPHVHNVGVRWKQCACSWRSGECVQKDAQRSWLIEDVVFIFRSAVRCSPI